MRLSGRQAISQNPLEQMVSNPVVDKHVRTRANESELVEVCCRIARERLEVGDYDGGVAALRRWWEVGEWPKQAGLNNRAAAELLLTAGTLSGLLASTNQFMGGQ